MGILSVKQDRRNLYYDNGGNDEGRDNGHRDKMEK